MGSAFDDTVKTLISQAVASGVAFAGDANVAAVSGVINRFVALSYCDNPDFSTYCVEAEKRTEGTCVDLRPHWVALKAMETIVFEIEREAEAHIDDAVRYNALKLAAVGIDNKRKEVLQRFETDSAWLKKKADKRAVGDMS